MANRIFPNWQTITQLPNPLTRGEKFLLEYLDKYLPQEWMIFAQPYLNGVRPDVIIFRPNVGVVIYEVKDWKLNSYEWDDDNFDYDFEGIESDEQKKRKGLFVKDRFGKYPIKNPIRQVGHYKEKIIGQLLPAIGELADKNSNVYGVIKVGLYFHNESTSRSKEFFKNYSQSHTPIFGNDWLSNKDHLKEIVPDVDRYQSSFWDKIWNDELLFWLNPPYHSLEQTIALKLTPRQKEHAEPQPGHFRLRGVAGSGKTQIISYRAAKLASQKKRVLILTFNITLWHYIRDMIQRAPFEFQWKDSFGTPYITFNHFHGFCKDVLNHYGVKWPQGFGEDLFRSIIVSVVKKVIDNNKNNYEKWDAILIDEGQDYYWEWYDLLCNFLTQRDELFFVVDKKQNIYDRELSWIDGGMKNVKFGGRWRELKTVFRLPKKLANYANQFSKTFNLSSEIEAEEVIQPTLFERSYDPHTIWREISPTEKYDMLWKAFEFLKNKKIAPSDIVILLPDKYVGQDCVDYFEQRKIGVNHVFEDEEELTYHKHKRAFWNGDGRLKMSTIHSFKGWESLNVIIFIPAKTKIPFERLDKVIYTAITRTRENIIVYNANSRYTKFGESLPSKWLNQ